VNRRILIILTMAAALAGCSSAAGSPTAGKAVAQNATPASEPGIATYLCRFSNGDLLLQWTNGNSYITGTYQDAALSGSPPQESVNTTQGSLSGNVSGSGITLDVGTATWYGTITGSSVTVNIPQQDGTIQPAACDQSSVSGWNDAIASLNSQADGDNNATLQQQAQASSQAANQQQEQNAQEAVNTLTQAADVSGAVNAIANDVQTTENSLATTRADAANGNGNECLNASTTVYNDAATTVYNDVLTTAYNDLQTVASDISTVRADVSTVQSDQSALQSGGLPTTTGASAAISGAQAAIASAITTVNADIANLNADLDTAYQIADSVGTGTCAGDGPGTPPAGLGDLE
jgi:hypothetical protein